MTLNSSYEKRLLIGDFNTETSGPRIDSFVYEDELHNLVEEKTCFKSVHNPSCIDIILIILTNKTTAVFTGLSDFHKLVRFSSKLVSLKVNLKKLLKILILLDLMKS